MSKEEWRPVPIQWLSKAFEVSNKGNIRHKPRPVSQRNVYGYRQVTFKYRGEELTIRVHRLVAGAFLKKPPGCDVVNHKNGNRSDNAIENLEWTTTQGNAQHASDRGGLRRGLNHYRGKIDPLRAFEMRRNGLSLSEIGREFGASLQAVKQLIDRAKRSKFYDPKLFGP